MINPQTKYLISIVGPTAIGKTALSIKLAQHFKTDIISADSRQFFKEMKIGTAAPTKTELAAAQHHFIHHKSIQENYSVGAFEKEALETLNQLFKNKNIVIMVGGSGLYCDAVTNGLNHFPKVDSTIREKLNIELEKKGLAELQKKLLKLDPITYNNIAISNPHRVIRALEICIGTEHPYSSYLNKPKHKRNFKTITIGLTAERALIYQRINQRVDIMLKNGLLNEVTGLLQYKNLNALNTVGYKELFNFLNNSWEYEFAISEIKKNSRRFAKRQLTWFKRNENTIWFDFNTTTENILSTLKPYLSNIIND